MRKLMTLVIAALLALTACGSPEIPESAYYPATQRQVLTTLNEQNVVLTVTYERYLEIIKGFCDTEPAAQEAAVTQAIDAGTGTSLSFWKIGMGVVCPEKVPAFTKMVDYYVELHNTMME